MAIQLEPTKSPEACKCTPIGSLIHRASRLLNDDVEDGDFVRWPKPVLLDYLNEALSHLQSLRPDAFTDTVALELKDGALQELPDTLDSLVSIDRNLTLNSDGSFSLGAPVVEENSDFNRYFPDGPCTSGQTCVTAGRKPSPITGFSKIAESSKEYTVSPPPVPGHTQYVSATVVRNAPYYCTEDLDQCLEVPGKYNAALLDWVLFRAYLTDIESEYAMRASQAARTRFYESLGVAYLQESRFNSGFYLGETGDGDEDSERRSRPT